MAPAAFWRRRRHRAGLVEAPVVQRVVEEKATQLLRSASIPNNSSFITLVEKVAEAAADPSAKAEDKIKLPFVAVDLRPKDHRRDWASPRRAPFEPDLTEYSATIYIVLDESVDDQVSSTISQILNEHFLIETAPSSKLATRKTRLHHAGGEIPADPNIEANQKAEADRARLDAEAARARASRRNARGSAEPPRARISARLVEARSFSQRTKGSEERRRGEGQARRGRRGQGAEAGAGAGAPSLTCSRACN